jgi:hypothetical protein
MIGLEIVLLGTDAHAAGRQVDNLAKFLSAAPAPFPPIHGDFLGVQIVPAMFPPISAGGLGLGNGFGLGHAHLLKAGFF